MISIQERLPSVGEFQQLRESTDWSTLSDEVVSKALQSTLFSVCAVQDERVIGMGRIVGDGAVYFYIQDVIVLPEFQGAGVGRNIMLSLETWLLKSAPSGAFIGLMAAEGAADFYTQFDYARRADSRPGMFKILRK